VAGTLVIVVISEETRRAFAEVGDFIADGLELFDEARGANCGGRFFGAGSEAGCAGGRANQGNLAGLTDDFDRQGTLLFCFSSCSCGCSGRRKSIPATAPARRCKKPCAQKN